MAGMDAFVKAGRVVRHRVKCYVYGMATQAWQPEADDDDDLVNFIELAIRSDDKLIDKHFAAGQAVYFVERETPAGCVIKAFPDGRRTLIRVDSEGNEHTVTPGA